MTNSRALGEELRRKCDGKHAHQSLVDGRAKLAAEYPEDLCRAICRGIIKLRMERECGIRVVAEIPSNLSSPSACAVARKIDLE